jgi:DNA polymerase-3 subunit delta'
MLFYQVSYLFKELSYLSLGVMDFKSVIGQERQIRQITSTTERMPHAILISGPEGSGKLPFALALSKWIFCMDKQESDACGLCSNCRRMESLNHPDFHATFPVFGGDLLPSEVFSRWKKVVCDNPYLSLTDWRMAMEEPTKQPNISARATQAIIQSLQLQSYEPGPKLHLIWLAEYLGKESNRLLKLIEEPPDNTFLILVTDHRNKILPTIQSRCQDIVLNPIAKGEIVRLLSEKYGIEDREADKIADWSDGDLNKAYFLVSDYGRDVGERWLEWMRLSFQGKGQELVKWINDQSRMGRGQMKSLFQYGTYYLREVLAYKAGKHSVAEELDKASRSALKMAQFLSIEGIQKISNMLDKSLYHLERNAHDKILLMNCSLQMGKILTSDFKANKN